MEKNIDPFDQMENGHDRIFYYIRQILSAAIVAGGSAWLVWFWFIK